MEQVRVNGTFRAKPDNVVSMHTFHGGNVPGGKQPGWNLPGGNISVTGVSIPWCRCIMSDVTVRFAAVMSLIDESVMLLLHLGNEMFK